MGKKIPAMGKSNIGMLNRPQCDDKEFISDTLGVLCQISALNTERCTSPEEMDSRLNKVIQICNENGLIPTVEMIMLATGIPQTSLYDMQNDGRPQHAEYSKIIKKYKDIIKTFDSILATQGKTPTGTYAFRAKNYYGMKDQQEVVLTPNTGVSEPVDAEKILKNVPQITNGENADK